MKFLALLSTLLLSTSLALSHSPTHSHLSRTAPQEETLDVATRALNETLLYSLESRAQIPGGRVITSCKKPNTVAITFDDGPFKYSKDISKILLSKGAKGTFFLNGNNYECIYSDKNIARIKYLHKRGHQLASHTWAHKDLATLSREELHTEMGKVEEALKRIVGVVPAFMRPPFGSYNDRVVEIAGLRGQTVSIWDFDSQDSMGASVSESRKLYRDAIKAHPSNILTLNHETIKSTARSVVEYAIDKLQAAGYDLVTMAECLGEEPYQSVGKPETQTAEWVC